MVELEAARPAGGLGRSDRKRHSRLGGSAGARGNGAASPARDRSVIQRQGETVEARRVQATGFITF